MTTKGMILGTMAVLLAGCGGGDDPPATTTSAASTEEEAAALESGDASSLVTTQPPQSIVLSYPHANAIVDTEQGVYRRTVVAMVTDQEGRPVADGTPVYLSLVDTVLAQGTIVSPDDGVSGTTLTDSDPTIGGTVVTDPHGNPWQLDSVFVVRNGGHRFIEPGDLLLLGIGEGRADEVASDAPVAEATDRYRRVGAVAGNTITVDRAYQNVYPTGTAGQPAYLDGEVSYVVGAALAGAQVAGVSQASDVGGEGEEGIGTNTTGGELTSGVAVTVDGKALFNISYPSNVAALNYGCVDPAVETRVTPPESAQLYLVARVNDEVVAVEEGFCFTPIKGGTITLMQESISANGVYVIDFLLVDGGNEVPVPFSRVAVVPTLKPSANSSLTVTVVDANAPANGFITTDENGWGSIRVEVSNGGSGDDGTIRLFALGASTTANISLDFP